MPREDVSIGVSGGTPGGDSNDYVLFNSVTCFPGGLQAYGISRVIFGVNNSQAGTRKAYWSADKGVTWNLWDSTAVTAAAAGAMSGPWGYLVDPYPDVKLVWTNGGVSQATWIPTLTAIRGERASST